MCEKRYSKKIFVYIVSIVLICFFGSEARSNNDLPNVHWVFCVDTSGSMKKKGQMDLLKEITERIAKEFIDGKEKILRIGDRVTLFSFDQDVRLEATSLYQTEDDLIVIKNRLKKMNERSGNLTFISEAIVQAMEITKKYSKFFPTSALYIFTDGKSEPYSLKWSKKKIMARKKRDQGDRRSAGFSCGLLSILGRLYLG